MAIVERTCTGWPRVDFHPCWDDSAVLPVALLMWAYTLLPYVFCFVVLVRFLQRRTTWLGLAGAMPVLVFGVNEVVLKNWIAQRRPSATCACGYGMPSGHAALAGALLTWATLEVSLVRPQLTQAARINWVLLVAVGTVPVPLSRIYLNFHTPQQVYAGVLEGAIIAILWFLMLQTVGTRLLSWVTSWPIMRGLALRDDYSQDKGAPASVHAPYNVLGWIISSDDGGAPLLPTSVAASGSVLSGSSAASTPLSSSSSPSSSASVSSHSTSGSGATAVSLSAIEAGALSTAAGSSSVSQPALSGSAGSPTPSAMVISGGSAVPLGSSGGAVARTIVIKQPVGVYDAAAAAAAIPGSKDD